jgi:dolichyl-phosphate beta-glucosyltransferase
MPVKKAGADEARRFDQNFTVHLSVIVPAFNEEERIRGTLEAVNLYLSTQPYRSEILVVDDGSIDQTLSIVTACMSSMSRLRLISRDRNRGKGAAVREGMLEASGTYKFFMDADGSTPIEHVGTFLPYLEAGIDVVVGSRTAHGSNIQTPQPPFRRMAGRIFRTLVRFVFALPVTDTQNGFKAFSRTAVQEIFPSVTTERWVFDVEALAIAKRRGLIILEIPVKWANRQHSRVTFLQGALIGIDLLRVVWRVRSIPPRLARAANGERDRS